MNNLRWNAVGLDFEPDFRELQWPRWRLAWTLLRRCFDAKPVPALGRRMLALIREMQAHGYRVQTYQLIFLADETESPFHGA